MFFLLPLLAPILYGLTTASISTTGTPGAAAVVTKTSAETLHIGQKA